MQRRWFLYGLMMCLCVMGTVYPQAQAPAYLLEHFSPERGLSQGSGYAVTQYDGFLWFGTQDGLNRFDGYRYKVYRADEPLSINDNFVQSLLSDRAGRLWVGTVKGVSLYDKTTQGFKSFKNTFGLNHLVNDASIRSMTEDARGHVWLMTDEEGLYKFDIHKKKLFRYEQSAHNFVDFAQSDDGTLWVLTDEELFRYDSATDRLMPMHLAQLLGLTKKSVLRASTTDREGNLWIGTYEDGVYVVSSQWQVLHHWRQTNNAQGLSSNEIKCFMRDHNGHIWIGTRNGGVSLYDIHHHSFSHLKHDPANPRSLGKNYVLSFFEDKQANVWIGLSGGGFDKYDPRKSPFQALKQNLEVPLSGLSDNMVFKILRQGDYLYIGTQAGGLSRYHLPTRRYAHFLPDSRRTDAILHSEVYDISPDADGHLWLATGRGLCEYFPESQRFESFPKGDPEGSLYLYTAQVLRESSEVWAGGQRGLFRFDGTTRRWKDWRDLPAVQSIAKFVVRLIKQDSQGNVWLGTLGHGLIRYDKDTQTIKVFDQRNGLTCANIRCLYEDRQTLWVGTDCGLFIVDLKTLTIKQKYSTKTGLVNNVIYGILKQDDQTYWLSSNRGLMKFDPQTTKIVHFTQDNGLESNEFNTNCAWHDPDETMYFGGVQGINYFRPTALQASQYAPPVRIVQVKAVDTIYAATNQELKLKRHQNFIDIYFSTFNFSNTEANSYRYRLEGIQQDWSAASTLPEAHYTNLPAGQYTFSVKGANSDGIENNAETKLTFEIPPAFWETPLFRSLLVLSLLGIVSLIFRNRIAKIREDEQRKTELQHIRAQAELVAMRAQINPHFIFNCLNTIDAYILTNQHKQASHFLQQFSRLIRMVLEHSSQELVLIKDDLEALQLYISLEEERYDHQFRSEVQVEPILISNLYLIPPMLLQPFVENAILHGLRARTTPGGLLRLKLQLVEEQLHIVIEDNGIGREASRALQKNRGQQHQSKGTLLTMQRIEAYGQLYDQKTHHQIIDLPQGTRVEIRLPLNKSAKI